jgi:hypothetical protein
MNKLTFRPNGHLFSVEDGEQVGVFTADPGHPFIPDLTTARCGFCDQLAKPLVVTDDAVTVATPCPYPNGLTSVITLNVPSGKIIVADDLRPVYNWDETEQEWWLAEDYTRMASYNSALGQYQAVQAMAAAGCAYGPVGNSCPGLYRTEDGTYVIASLAYSEETDDEVLPAGWEHLASVITDLWAYSIADFEDWKARGGDPESLGWGQTVLDVTPGTYEFTHHTGERTFNRDAEGTVIFAHVQFLEGEKE